MDKTLLCEDGCRYYIKSELSGYSDGERWDDGAAGQVRHIAIFYGDVIHSIQTSYEREGIVATSRIHGGNYGNFEMVDLHNEPLTWVSGYYGSWCWDPEIFTDEETDPWNYEKVIRSLKFGTDTRTYGPFGKELGKPFSYKTGTEISGFHGCSSGSSSGGYLHGIGVYVRSPATCIINEPQMPMVKNLSLSEAKTLPLPEAKTVASISLDSS